MGSRELAPTDFGPCRSSTPFRKRRAFRRGPLVAVIFALVLCAPALLHAQDFAAPPSTPQGDAPAAAKQDTSPLSAHVSFTQFVQAAVSGGIDNDVAYGGRIDVDARIDTRLMGLWKGGSLSGKLVTRYGETASRSAGVIIPVNSALIDPAASGTATSLIALYYTQMLPLGKKLENLLMVSLGRFSTFDMITEPFLGGTGLTRFMNLNQIGPPHEGRNVPSVTLGGSMAVLLEGEPVFSFAVLDPQSSQMTSGLGNLFGRGVTLAPAFDVPTHFFARTGHQRVRASWSSQRVTPFDAIPQLLLPLPDDTTGVERVRGSWAVTYSADQYIAEAAGPPHTGWGLFWQVGFADERTNPITTFVNVGFGGNSPFRGRAQDLWGLGFAWTGLGGDFKDLFDPLVRLRDGRELEAFYNLALTPWLRFTGDLQVVRPSRPNVDTAIIPGARLQLVF